MAEAASAAQQQLQQQQPEQGRLSSIFISGVVTEPGNVDGVPERLNCDVIVRLSWLILKLRVPRSFFVDVC